LKKKKRGFSKNKTGLTGKKAMIAETAFADTGPLV